MNMYHAYEYFHTCKYSSHFYISSIKHSQNAKAQENRVYIQTNMNVFVRYSSQFYINSTCVTVILLVYYVNLNLSQTKIESLGGNYL